MFNRAKDWLDIEQILTFVPAFQVGEVHRWLEHLVGPDDARAPEHASAAAIPRTSVHRRQGVLMDG